MSESDFRGRLPGPVTARPVEVVEVARGEAAAVELHHRAQLRRDHRDRLEDHPLGLVLRLDERGDDLQTLDRALLLLPLGRLDDLPKRGRLALEIEVAEQVSDRLGAHAAREVLAEAVRRTEAVLELTEDLLVVDDELRLEALEGLPRLGEATLRVVGGIASILAAGFDVEVHLPHLQRPLDERIQVLLLDLPVRAQAQVIGLLADRVGRVELRQRLQQVLEQAVPQLASLLQVLLVDARDELRVLAVQRLAGEQAVDHLVDVLRDRTLLGAGRLRRLLEERPQRLLDLDGGRRDLLQLARAQTAVVADRRVADELADLLGVFRGDVLRHLEEESTDQLSRLLERRQGLLFGPVREPAGPELVVLVEVPLPALGEVLAPPLQAVLERGQRLLTVDVDALVLRGHLVLEVVQVLLPRLGVDRRHDRGGEVEDLLELARSDVEQVADPARDTLEEPNVRDRRREVDMAHALAPHLLAGHLDTAALADDPLVADALVLAAVALPVLRGTEDALAEEAVALGLKRAVVDRLRLRHLAGGPVADLLARGEPDPDGVEIVDVDQIRVTPVFLRLNRVILGAVGLRLFL
jgi:hypothetical protein